MTKSDEPLILLVELDVLIRQPLAEYLRECGYRVLEARNHLEARQVLEARSAEIDLVLASTAGFSENAFALATWIRTNHIDVDVALLGSVENSVEKVRDLCEDGPEEITPYEHRLVLDRIRRMLASRSSRARKG